MKVGIREIAQRIGVSPATVSNALNNRPGVSGEISRQILALADEMGYRRDRRPSAKPYVRLVVYKCHGLVVGNTQFFFELTEGIELECQLEKVELVVSQVDKVRDAAYLERITAICADECRGVILLGTEMENEDLALFRQCRSPLVVADNLFAQEQVHAVVMNNFEAGRQATRALLQAGHTRIGHISSSVAFNNASDRRRGYQAALREAGLTADEALIWHVAPTIDGAYQDMRALLAHGMRLPTAFFAANDIIAVGCMRALQEAGYHIPQDISMIGMDDTALCQASTPPLSTIRVHRQELGRMAVGMLLHNAPMLQSSVIKAQMSVSVIERDSVAPPCTAGGNEAEAEQG